jgi:hypothetical protein
VIGLDLTATAFGLLVTVVGALFTAVVLLARRELDRHREQVTDLDHRLRLIERKMDSLEPVVTVLERNAQDDGQRFVKGARLADRP